MNVIEYENVKVCSAFDGFMLSGCSVTVERNAHAKAEIILTLKDGSEQTGFPKNAEDEIISLYDSVNHVILFSGKIKKIETCINGNDQKWIIWANSHSIELDDEKISRSFQNVKMTFQELASQVVEDQAAIFCSQECERPIDRIYVQYHETNWEFLKRIAGELGISLFADMTKERPVVYLGTREIEEETEFDRYKYSRGISPLYYAHQGGDGFDKADYEYYDLESYENYEIGSRVKHQNGSFWICRKKFRLEKGQICFSYRISKRGLLFTRKSINESLSGASLSGKVLETEKELLKIHLDIDKEQDKDTAFMFQWTPLSGNMMYCMPQVGTKVNLYFADGDETSAKAISCVGGEKDHISMGQGPSYRAFTSEHGKRMELMPDALRFSTGGMTDAKKSEAVLKDGLDILFSSEHKISICAQGEVKIEGQSQSACGMTAVQLVQTGAPVSEESINDSKASIEIAGNESYYGDNVSVEAHGERKSCPPFGDAPQEEKFDWFDLLEKAAVGLAVAAAVAVTVAAVAVSFGAAAPFAAIVWAGVLGGGVAIGCLAYSDYKSGNVSDWGHYIIKGISGSVTGSLAVACGPTAMSGKFWTYVGKSALTGAWTSGAGNLVDQGLEGAFYKEDGEDKFDEAQFFCSVGFGGLFSGFAGGLSYGATNSSQAFKNFAKLSDNKLIRKLRFYGGESTSHVDRTVSKIAGQKFESFGEAMQWAKNNPRSMVMSLGAEGSKDVAIKTAIIEVPTSNTLSGGATMMATSDTTGVTANSLDLAREYIAAYGY